MVRVYYLGENNEELDPVSLSDLEKLGLEYHKLNPHDYEEDLKKIREKNGYTYFDVIHCDPEHLPDFETKVKYFAEEYAVSSSRFFSVTKVFCLLPCLIFVF